MMFICTVCNTITASLKPHNTRGKASLTHSLKQARVSSVCIMRLQCDFRSDSGRHCCANACCGRSMPMTRYTNSHANTENTHKQHRRCETVYRTGVSRTPAQTSTSNTLIAQLTSNLDCPSGATVPHSVFGCPICGTKSGLPPGLAEHSVTK